MVVDESPVLEELVHTQDCAYVSCEVAPARRLSEVLLWILNIRVDHEIPVFLVSACSISYVHK